MKQRLSEEEITQLRDLIEIVSMENSSPQSLPTANRKLRRLCYIGEWAMIVIPCCTHFPLAVVAFLGSLLSGNIQGALFIAGISLMGWPFVLIFWVLPIILFFVFRSIRKKAYFDEVMQIKQLISKKQRVRKYIEDKAFNGRKSGVKRII